MKPSKQQLWERFRGHYREFPGIGLAMDISRMNFAEDFFERMDGPIRRAFSDMDRLEKGGIANPDENRMVGHYWLRNPSLAPNPEIAQQIEQTLESIRHFAAEVHAGRVQGRDGPFENFLLIGIGGSALGPQFVAHALSNPATDKLKPYFLDNTDPDGMDKTFAQLTGSLGRTLCIVISKSGGTKETRNGMLETKACYERNGYEFSEHAVAVTGVGSELDQTAAQDGWLRRFPMWDWVGGRTSEFSAVGLLPAALQGFSIDSLLAGANACDTMTRRHEIGMNPAARLALMWFCSGNGKGDKDMVVLPYRDRLELFSKYLQQLVMESLGKAQDLSGRTVNQGIVVYGNKGATDQHAYVQQLREGPNNFFVTFIEVLEDRKHPSVMVDPEVTSGDYLKGFLLGTREALFGADRESLTLTIADLSEFHLGVLIALFERAVGFYASLVGINAYHQPGVEAGKKAAAAVIGIQTRVLKCLKDNPRAKLSVEEIAGRIGAPEEAELVFKICQQLSASIDHPVHKVVAGETPFDARYEMI